MRERIDGGGEHQHGMEGIEVFAQAGFERGEHASRVRRAQQAAREAMDAIGEMVVRTCHGDEFVQAPIGIGFLFAQYFHLPFDQRDGGPGAHVRQAHA